MLGSRPLDCRRRTSLLGGSGADAVTSAPQRPTKATRICVNLPAMHRTWKRPRIVPLLLGVLAVSPPSAGQTPTAAETYAAKCAMCHMPDGKAQLLEMNFVEGSWKHGN